MKKTLILFLFVVGPVFNTAAAWKAAITPEKPLWMAGYAARKTGAQGKLQGSLRQGAGALR